MSLDKITLITGLIGSGKTLRAVWYIDQEVKAGRAVYVCNLDGINIPGVIPWEDPRQWQDLPPGALLVVDEAQRFWRARRAGEVPPELQAMETSRHDAVSMLLLTQQPGYLDKHLRGLVTRHEHLYRRMGAPAASLYVWERCVEDPNSATDKDGADQSMFVYPKQLYGAYKSAEKHTTKVRLGARAKLIIAGMVLGVGLIGSVFYDHSAGASEPTQEAAAVSAVGAADAGAVASLEVAQGASWEDRFRPRDPQRPWSAAAWDGRAVVSDPQVFCMAVGPDGRDGCSCYTEQATRYEMDLDLCLVLAFEGARYNPFKQPEREREKPVELGGESSVSVESSGVGLVDLAQGALSGAVTR